MIDWEQIKPQDLSFSLCGDEIYSHRETVFIPVNVLHPDCTVLFKHVVALKATFYQELRQLPDWSQQLNSICRARLLEIIRLKTREPQIPVQDKMELFHEAPKRF